MIILPKWHSCVNGLSIERELLGKSLFILAGPSGVGKTSVALTMAELSNRIFILPNYTTRNPRNSDPVNHFNYINDLDFRNLLSNDEFFLCRAKPYPCYGYLKKDINQAVSQNSVSLFMFRYSGAKYLSDLIENIPIIFLEGNADIISKQSTDTIEKHSAESSGKVIENNRILFNRLNELSWPCMQIVNQFSGKEELVSIANSILSFLEDINA